MTAIQYLNAFRVYGADVLLLALGVTLLTSLLKKTAMKNCPKKVYVILPFALGLVFYAVYRAIATMSAKPFTADLLVTLEGGFACGCAATLYYVVYEQFFRSRTLPPVSELLHGVVPEEKIAEAAGELTAGWKKAAAEERFPFVTEALRKYADPPLAETELAFFAKAVSEFLTALYK